jgi:hypothetical protein
MGALEVISKLGSGISCGGADVAEYAFHILLRQLRFIYLSGDKGKEGLVY